MKTKISEAIDANIAVHSAMANEYNKVEPHFRPESIKRVKEIISELSKKTPLTNALDLGCGTGFMIDILKGFSSKIVGVDVTQPMLDKVDMSGPAQIELINSDTGSVKLTENYFDIATAYTFLDHLYDLKPTLINTYNSLRPGGVFYADLSPNFYFWQEVKSLNTAMEYDSIVQREVNAVLRKDEEIEQQFGVRKEVFQAAEHQKHLKGGLKEEELVTLLSDIGFSKVEFIYHWFVGQAELINNQSIEEKVRFEQADLIHQYLTRARPMSRNLFKYVGFIATK